MPKLRGQKLAAYLKRREVWAGTGVIAAALVISFFAGRDHPPVIEDSLETLRFGELEPLPSTPPVVSAAESPAVDTESAPAGQPMTGWVVANEPVSLDWAPPVAPAPRSNLAAAPAVEDTPEPVEEVVSTGQDVLPTGADTSSADQVGRAVVPLPPVSEPAIEVVDERPMVRPARLSGHIDHVEPFTRRTSLRNNATTGTATR